MSVLTRILSQKMELNYWIERKKPEFMEYSIYRKSKYLELLTLICYFVCSIKSIEKYIYIIEPEYIILRDLFL